MNILNLDKGTLKNRPRSNERGQNEMSKTRETSEAGSVNPFRKHVITLVLSGVCFSKS